MIRNRIIIKLRALAESLGEKTTGSQWHLFGSVNRDEQYASDIDLMILCKDEKQADVFRQALDPDELELPLHLSLMTFKEAEKISATNLQRSSIIFP